MECTRCQEALSARIDGEDPGIATGALDAHLARCAACRSWLATVTPVTRALRVASAEPKPELMFRILAAYQVDRSARGSVELPLPVAARVGLTFMALAQLALSLPQFLDAALAGVPAHLAQDLASWDVALAVGFLFVAYKPGRAAGMLPLVGALVALVFATLALGAAGGRGMAVGEALHMTEVGGLGLLWLLARSQDGERPVSREGLS